MNKKITISFIGLALLAAAAAAGYHLQMFNFDLSLLFGTGVVMATVPAVLTEEQVRDFRGLVTDLKSGWADLKNLPASVKSVQDDTADLQQQVADLRRQHLRARLAPQLRAPGVVSDDCARHLSAHFVAHCERSGKLEALASLPSQREALMAFACNSLGLTTRSALTTTDIPLPVEYGGEIRELISSFGVVRRQMAPYPI